MPTNLPTRPDQADKPQPSAAYLIGLFLMTCMIGLGGIWLIVYTVTSAVRAAWGR